MEKIAELRECLLSAFERLDAAGATLHPVLVEPLERMAELLGIEQSLVPTETRDLNRITK